MIRHLRNLAVGLMGGLAGEICPVVLLPRLGASILFAISIELAK